MESLNKESVFEYYLPASSVDTSSYKLMDQKVIFHCPMRLQICRAISYILRDENWNEELKTVVEFGCTAMHTLQFIKRIPSLELILEVDAKKEILLEFKHKVMPLVGDHLLLRENPLCVNVLHGKISQPDKRIRNIDVVLAPNVIHQLLYDDLVKVPENIFNFIKPKLAVFVTPNIEFNVLFDRLLPNGLRSAYHHFEWTRKELETWALEICKSYSDYKVSFLGLGKAPEGDDHLGYSAYLVLFARKDFLHGGSLAEGQQYQEKDHRSLPQQLTKFKEPKEPEDGQDQAEKDDIMFPENYEEIFSINYPYEKNKATLEEQIYDKIRSFINDHGYSSSYYNNERFIYEVPINTLTKLANAYFENTTKDDVINILKNNKYEIENDKVILPEDNYGDDDGDYNYEDNYYEDNNNYNHAHYDYNSYEENKENYVLDEEENWD